MYHLLSSCNHMTSQNPKWQCTGNLKTNIRDNLNFCNSWMLFSPCPVKFEVKQWLQTIQSQLVVRVEVPFEKLLSWSNKDESWHESLVCLVHSTTDPSRFHKYRSHFRFTWGSRWRRVEIWTPETILYGAEWTGCQAPGNLYKKMYEMWWMFIFATQ